MREKIEQAFIDFKNGKRPVGYREPPSWYVLDKNGLAYPAKTIYALAKNENLGDFHTRAARLALSELGYSLINVSNTNVSNINDKDFENDVIESINDSAENRRKRLEQADKKPQVSYRMVKGYSRNRDVVDEVLVRANGQCELCGCAAPFNRRSNNTPYLVVHHVIQLANGGDDSTDNAKALCPNCHREKHWG